MEKSDEVTTRHLFHLNIEDDEDGPFVISLDHVYLTQSHFCEKCNKQEPDAGVISLSIVDDEDETVTVFLDASEALVLANRIERAANIILEDLEDPESMDRAALRYIPSDSD